jgi:putative two-component system response regulator
MESTLNNIVLVLSDIIESRNKVADGHAERTIKCVRIITEAMLAQGVYATELCTMDLDLFCASASLHDIGKISIPDVIINKPDRLTENEFEIMKSHTIQGELIIDRMISKTTGKDEFLRNAKLFAGYHHERWDGKGYPRRLSRLNIPLQGRILEIVDVYDALVSERPYKQPFTHEEAVKIIMDSTGEMFDPLITEIFLEVNKQFEGV